ncbi:uncharacterized protein N7498_009248 [Penicillium cinerascens]|uniref:Uncharacterized protein n=1 Tax=Penicillium cinerascens TaxID=70096 RepID=A0A9W9J562_9EURO|nr:uncharacterized protein N7498_009248 [Penicillium cinerascens]KAJ5190263.1 hypothetical protein N7498_009248 [Penicillium cinerascens]
MAAEAMARGFDPGAVARQFAFSAPGTDVVDVGTDFYNSELFNSFLNSHDIMSTGSISENSLRRVYDAYAHIGATIFMGNWSDPGSIVCANLYSWHILNDRHEFLRRAVLGSSKMRTGRSDQRYAEWDEAFDEDGQTTGFSRPLSNACNGFPTCDQIEAFLERSGNKELLEKIWYLLSIGPAEYVSRGLVDELKEKNLVDTLELAMANAYSYGLVHELRWLLAHASHHAWQVNYVFEAAMFGSLLDDGGLEGKLDRYE